MAITERLHEIPVRFRNLPSIHPEEHGDYPKCYPDNLIEQDNLLRKRLGMWPGKQTIIELRSELLPVNS